MKKGVKMENACRMIIEDILNGKISTRRELEIEKRQLCRDLKLSRFMSNADILEHAKPQEKELVSGILKKKPTRTKFFSKILHSKLQSKHQTTQFGINMLAKTGLLFQLIAINQVVEALKFMKKQDSTLKASLNSSRRN